MRSCAYDEPGLERGLHEADRARRGLQAAVLEAGHLEVEAAAEPALAADEVLGGHEPVVERDLVRVHAAVADRVDRAAFHLAAAPVVERERVTLGARLLDDEHRQAAVALRLDRGRCGRAASARRRDPANVAHVFTPLTSQPPSVGVAVTFTPATSEP